MPSLPKRPIAGCENPEHCKKVVDRYTKQLLRDPKLIFSKIKKLEINGIYLPLESQKKEAIQEAVTLWSLFYQESAFYGHIENQIRMEVCKLQHGSYNFKANFTKVVDDNVKTHSGLISDYLQKSTNPFVKIFCKFMYLPVDVARKWLWHENIDFQSPESFLRRLTPEQQKSLDVAYQHSISKHSGKKYPCFADGLSNKTWQWFGLNADKKERMVPKSALAYDFLGFNIGFQKFPELNNDKIASEELTTQFLSDENRGSFEVNTEHGGLYWYLYKTLRSNWLFNSEGTVELGRWICPGFWFTMIAWFFMLVVSPLALVASLGMLLTSTEFFSSLPKIILLIIGLVSPLLFIGNWASKNLSRGHFDKEYWPILFLVIVWTAVGFLFYFFIKQFSEYLTFWMLVLDLIVLLPYCIKYETGKFWELDKLGKPLVLATVAILIQDIYVHSMFWEKLLLLLVLLGTTIMSFLVENLQVLTYTLLSLLAYGTLTYISFHYFFGNVKKVHESIESKKILNDETYQGIVLLNYCIPSMAILALFGIPAYVFVFLGSTLSDVQIFSVFILVLLMTVPYMVVLRSVAGGTLDRKQVEIDKFISQTFGDSKGFVTKGLKNNTFLFDPVTKLLKVEILDELYSVVRSNAGLNWKSTWLCFAEVISSSEEFNCVLEFFGSAKVVEKDFRILLNNNLITVEIARRIAKNQSIETISKQLLVAKDIADNQIERKKIAINKFFVLYSSIIGVLASLLRIVTFPFRLIWKGVRDIYTIWETFNKRCPQSETSDGKSFI